MPPQTGVSNAPGRTRTCGPLLSFQHQAFPDRPSKWGCWLDYILDVPVPTRIVSEDPLAAMTRRFPADYPILTGCYLDHEIKVPEALRASPHTGSSTQWVPTTHSPLRLQQGRCSIR